MKIKPLVCPTDEVYVKKRVRKMSRKKKARKRKHK